MDSNINGRQVYDTARRALYRAFPNVPVDRFKTTQSYIRLEQAAAVGQTLYTFPLLVNQGNTFNTEQRLNLQDSFVISEIGFYLALPGSSTDATYQLQTQPSPFIFTQFAQLRNFYNGQLKMSVNNNTILPAWDLYRHWYAGQTQQTAAFGAGSPLNEFRGASDALYPVEPNIVLVGSKNYQINITLPAGPTAIDANTRVILIFRGILAQNSTVVS